MFLKAYQAFLDEFRTRKSHIFIFLSNDKISKKSINFQISWNFMNFEECRFDIIGSDLDVLKSFYRYVIVSLDFPLHTENVFRSLPSVFGWILGQEKPHFHIFVKWENFEKIGKSSNFMKFHEFWRMTTWHHKKRSKRPKIIL